MRRVRRIITNLLYLFISFLIFLTGQTVAETIKIKANIRKFTSLGVYQPDIRGDGKIRYYKVSRETWHPKEFERDPFFNDDPSLPGAEGDIFVTRQAPLASYPGVFEFVSFYFGGHAAYFGENNDIYETFGFYGSDETLFGVIKDGGENTYVQIEDSNYWLDPNYRHEGTPSYDRFGTYYRKEWIGLRVKGVTKGEVKQVTSFMNVLVDNKAQYNHLFIFNTKDRYYCTDMMSRAYATITNSNGESKYNLNNDGVATTVNDLILSKDTYISYYVTTDKDNVKHVYYIG